MIRIALKTTGCKVNQADGEALRRALSDLPVAFVPFGQAADVVVVNGCAVTRGAERDGRAWLNRGGRTGADVILAGCLAARVHREGGDGRVAGTVAVLPGTADRSGLVARLRDEVLRRAAGADVAGLAGVADVTGRDGGACGDRLPPPRGGRGARGTRARPLVKVQDGCHRRCTYCIVPLLRGPSTSVPLPQVCEAVRAAADAGAAEVVLAGVDLAAWGREAGDDLAGLLEGLSRLGTGLRFRLSSVEPWGLTDRLVEALALPDVCPHLHVPLQSGSEPILRAMGRAGGMERLAGQIRRCHRRVPGLRVGMDVLVGFPGESDADFQATFDRVADLPVTDLHVFAFSPRPGTAAASLPDDVPAAVKARRSRALRALAADRAQARARSLVGTVVEVVDVRPRPGGGVESVAGDGTRVLRQDPAGPRDGRRRVTVTGSRGADATAGREDP